MSQEQDEIFFRNFIGEYVQVMATIATEPIEIYGYLLHKDETNFYLGAGIERIDAMIRIDSVTVIQVADETKQVHPLIMDLKAPTEPEGIM